MPTRPSQRRVETTSLLSYGTALGSSRGSLSTLMTKSLSSLVFGTVEVFPFGRRFGVEDDPRSSPIRLNSAPFAILVESAAQSSSGRYVRRPLAHASEGCPRLNKNSLRVRGTLLRTTRPRNPHLQRCLSPSCSVPPSRVTRLVRIWVPTRRHCRSGRRHDIGDGTTAPRRGAQGHGQTHHPTNERPSEKDVQDKNRGELMVVP